MVSEGLAGEDGRGGLGNYKEVDGDIVVENDHRTRQGREAFFHEGSVELRIVSIPWDLSTRLRNAEKAWE